MLQVKLLSCPQHRASSKVTFWDEWSSLVLGTTQVGASLSSAHAKMTLELHRDGLTDELPAFLALPRSPAPGRPRAPLSRRSPRPQPSARLAPPGPQPLVSSSRLAPGPAHASATRLAIGPCASRAADWRPPQPAPVSPNARRPCDGIGRAALRPALLSPARQRVSRAEG